MAAQILSHLQAPWWILIKTVWMEQNGWHVADNIFKCMLLKENICVLLQISLKFILKHSSNNKSSYIQTIQVLDSHYTFSKPLPESVMTQLTD